MRLGRSAVLASSFLLAVVGTAAADPVKGNVLDGITLQPIRGATVVAPDGTTVKTDKAGAFTLDVEPGTVQVSAEAEGYDAITEELTVLDGGLVDYVLLLFKPGAAFETIEVEDEAPIPPTPGRQDLSRKEITRIPGTRGDALTAVRSLPGVANAVGGGSGPGLVVIRGAAPEDSKITIDGVEVPVLYHFFGLQSVLPSEFIENIEFLPGGFGAEEGRATGGVINVVTRSEAAPDTSGFAELSFINVAGFVQTPLTKKLTLTVAARRSIIDFILPAVVPDTVSFTTAPQYYDGQLRLDWRRGEGDRVSLLAFTSFDLLSLISEEIDPNNPEFTGGFNQETSFTRAILQWSKSRGKWSNRLVGSAGTNGFRVEIGEDRYIKVDQQTLEVRDDVTYQPHPRVKMRAGAEARWNPRDVSVKFPAQPSEGEPPPQNFGTLPLVEFNQEIGNSVAGAYLAADAKLADKTTLTAGGRFDYYDHITATTFLPRLQLTQGIGKDLTVRGAIGQYSRGFDFGESIPTNIDPERANQYVVGAEVKMNDQISVSNSVFYTSRSELLVQDPLMEETNPLDAYVNRGTGRSYGVEYLLKAKTGNFFGWLSYTYSRSDRVDGPMRARRLFDFDQTHNLIAVASWTLGKWELGGRWQYSTGQPTTPVIGSVYLSDINAFIPLYGEVNSERIETAHSMDLRVDRKWKFKSWELSAYIDITNVYAHARVLGYSYNYDFSEREAFKELPFVPALGVRGTF
jgi:outer membrane receptor protein involved in Fe transport